MHLIQETVHVVLDLLTIPCELLLDRGDDFLFVAWLLYCLPDDGCDRVKAIDGREAAHAFAHGNNHGFAGDNARNYGFPANQILHLQTSLRPRSCLHSEPITETYHKS